MSDVADTIQEAVEKGRESRLNSAVAVLVALTAVMMGLCNIKDGNIVQAMSQAQAHAVDSWSYFQAKSTKQHMAENMEAQIEIQAATGGNLSPATRAMLDTRLDHFRAQAATLATEKDTIRQQAEAAAREYDRLNVHDDQFDMADAAFAISIALYGITALTRRRWLMLVAILATGFGTWSGLCGFMGWSFHPSWLTGWLG